MAHQPELLILDEPTSGLDTMVRREFLESMVDIAAEGRTVLLSSHQIGEVERVADFVAIVHGGRLLAVEQLDQMKQSTLQLTVTVNDAAAPATHPRPNHPSASPRPPMGRTGPLTRTRRPRTIAIRRWHRRRRIPHTIARRNLRRLHGPIATTHHNPDPPSRLRFSFRHEHSHQQLDHAQFTGHSKTDVLAFVWKEFRMIRGLWLAVAIMGSLSNASTGCCTLYAQSSGVRSAVALMRRA